jgi:hypothetical protein
MLNGHGIFFTVRTYVHALQSTHVVSYSNTSYTLVKSYHSCWVHLKHPEFDLLGVVDQESTLEASI